MKEDNGLAEGTAGDEKRKSQCWRKHILSESREASIDSRDEVHHVTLSFVLFARRHRYLYKYDLALPFRKSLQKDFESHKFLDSHMNTLVLRFKEV